MKNESKTTHTKRIVVRVSDNLHGQTKQKAEENGLSVSAFVRMLIQKCIKGDEK